MSIRYHRGDALPAWEAEIILDPNEDFSTGWTFAVTATMPGQAKMEKTTGMIGSLNRVTTFWALGDLDLAPGTWDLKLKCTRTIDGVSLTVEEALIIEA